MNFYSQIKQDEIFLKQFDNPLTKGFYLDVGANNGVTFSNTKTLEELGWKGICVEPNPHDYSQLVLSRPKAKCVKVAVYNKNGHITFSTPANGLVGGIKDTLTSQKSLWEKHGQIYKDFDVECKTLFTILEENEAPTVIDYFSLDTEGSEADILECFYRENNGKYIIQYLDVEHNYDSLNIRRLHTVCSKMGMNRMSQNAFDFTYSRQ